MQSALRLKSAADSLKKFGWTLIGGFRHFLNTKPFKVLFRVVLWLRNGQVLFCLLWLEEKKSFFLGTSLNITQAHNVKRSDHYSNRMALPSWFSKTKLSVD